MNDTQELSRVQLLARAQAFVEKQLEPFPELSRLTGGAGVISMWLMEFAEGEMGECVPKTWDGLMEILRAYYPPEVFDGSSGDVGAQIVVLTRALDEYRAKYPPQA